MQLQNEREEFIGRLYAANFDLLEKMCYRLTGYDSSCSDLVADVIQEAFIAADRNWQKLSNHPNPSGWLVLTCQNRMKDALRKERRQRHSIAWSLDEEGSLPMADPYSALDAWIDREADQHQVEEVLKALTPDEREVASNYFIKGKKMREIAGESKASMSAVKSAVSRIRTKAREILKK